MAISSSVSEYFGNEFDIAKDITHFFINDMIN